MAHSSISNYSNMFFQEKAYGMIPDFELYINCTRLVDLKEVLNKWANTIRKLIRLCLRWDFGLNA